MKEKSPLSRLNKCLQLTCIQHEPSLEIIHELIRDKADVNAQDKEGNTCLHLACDHENPNLNIIAYLLKAGAMIDQINHRQETVFHLVLSKRYPDKQLISYLFAQKDFDAPTRDHYGMMYLHSACIHQNVDMEIIEFFLQKGVGFYLEDTYHNIIRIAGLNPGALEVFKFLITEFSLDPLTKQNHLQDCLRLACDSEHSDPGIIRYLLDAQKVDIHAKDEDGYDGLYYACKNLSITKAVIEVLLKAGANLNEEYYIKSGHLPVKLTSLLIAARNPAMSSEVMGYLLQHATGLSHPDNIYQFISNLRNPAISYDIMKLLVNKNINFNQIHWGECILFHSACRNAAISSEALQLLVQHKADPTLKERFPHTNLYLDENDTFPYSNCYVLKNWQEIALDDQRTPELYYYHHQGLSKEIILIEDTQQFNRLLKRKETNHTHYRMKIEGIRHEFKIAYIHLNDKTDKRLLKLLNNNSKVFFYMNALHYACTAWPLSLNKIKYLENHCDIRELTRYGESCIDLICQRHFKKSQALYTPFEIPQNEQDNSLEVIQYLLDKGVPYQKKALSEACAYLKNLKIIKLLLENKADPNYCPVKDKYRGQKAGDTIQPIYYFLGHKFYDASTGCAKKEYFNPQGAELLIQHGANLNLKNHSEAGTPLASACCIYPTPYSLIQLMLEKGADVNQESTISTPMENTHMFCLEIAIRKQELPLVLLLLCYGAHVNLVRLERLTQTCEVFNERATRCGRLLEEEKIGPLEESMVYFLIKCLQEKTPEDQNDWVKQLKTTLLQNHFTFAAENFKASLNESGRKTIQTLLLSLKRLNREAKLPKLPRDPKMSIIYAYLQVNEDNQRKAVAKVLFNFLERDPLNLRLISLVQELLGLEPSSKKRSHVAI